MTWMLSECGTVCRWRNVARWHVVVHCLLVAAGAAENGAQPKNLSAQIVSAPNFEVSENLAPKNPATFAERLSRATLARGPESPTNARPSEDAAFESLTVRSAEVHALDAELAALLASSPAETEETAVSGKPTLGVIRTPIDELSGDLHGQTAGEAPTDAAMPLTVEVESRESISASNELANTAAKERADDLISPSSLSTRIAELQAMLAMAGANPAQLEPALALLDKAQKSAQATAQLEEQSQKYRTDIETAPELAERLRAAQATTTASRSIRVDANASLADLESRLDEARQELESTRQRREERRRKTLADVDDKKALNERLQGYGIHLEQVEGALGAGPPSDASPEVADAWIRELNARRRLWELRSDVAKLEVERFDALNPVRLLERDAEQRQLSLLESYYQQWSDVVDQRRRDESTRQAELARKQARDADPAWREMANRNAELAEKRLKYADVIGPVTDEKAAAEKKLAQATREFSQLKRRVNSIGMNETIGMLLRTRRGQLMDVRPLRGRSAEIGKMLPSLQWELSQLREERTALWSTDELAEQYLAQIAPELLAQFPDDLAQSMVRDLLETRRRYLDDLLQDLHTYVNSLADLNIALRDSLKLTLDEAAFIDERILWIRNADYLQVDDFRQSQLGIRSLLRLQPWATVFHAAVRVAVANPWLDLLLLGLFAAWLGISDRLTARCETTSRSANIRAAYRFWPTMETLLITLLLASLAPGLTYLLGWKLADSHTTNDLTQAIGSALRWTALMWWALSFLEKVSRADGLGERHFGWHEDNTRVLRGNLHWLIFLGLPVLFTVMMIQSYQNGVWRNSLGRHAYIVGMLLMIIFMHSLLNPYRKGQGIWAKSQVWLFHLRFVMHGIGIAVPLYLALLAAIGYVFSAYQLAYRAQLTLWLTLGLTLTHALVTRYFLVVRRRTAVRHMKKRQAEVSEAGGERSDESIAENRLDFVEIGSQLQRLLRSGVSVGMLVGLSLIWADMVPALKALDRVELWHVETMVASSSLGEDGQPVRTNESKLVPVTMADSLLGLLTIALTIVGTRNLPGLLNLTIFERLPIDHGARYALTLVTRYVTMTVGVAVALQWVGISWQSVQWLAAAMTVGLGFGLQEIFANFVSGLIILTERPIRIGDIVTVGGITGKVSRMQMRATTITDFDRRELVVPNKKFITEDVVNWTLSDPVTRIVLPVGIAYDCDPKVACETLLGIARNHSLILREPEPTAIFTGFGDSTLNLELRAFIVGRDTFATIQDELNLAINERFRAANIEIAYPQRDLHLRTVHPSVAQATEALSRQFVAPAYEQTTDRVGLSQAKVA